MSLPDGYSFRTPTAADADAIGALFVAERDRHPQAPILDAHFIRETWTRAGFDLASDAWVVTDAAGAVVAYGHVRQEEDDAIGSWGLVRPDRNGLGIGAALFDRIEARVAERSVGHPAMRFRHAITTGDDAAAAIATARELRPVHHNWHMQVDLEPPVDQGEAPDGIDIGEMGEDGLAEAHAVLADAFVDDWADLPGPRDRWIAEELASPSFDPTLWLMARDGATPVGLAAGSAGEDGGAVDWLGVIRSHRGRGIGGALLRRSFARFAARGITTVMVSVDADNVTGATGVYERAGMRVVGRWDLWERGPHI